MADSMFAEATRLMDCPKCGAKAGQECRTPKGRVTNVPHVPRFNALIEHNNTERFAIPLVKNPLDILFGNK